VDASEATKEGLIEKTLLDASEVQSVKLHLIRSRKHAHVYPDAKIVRWVATESL